MAGTPDNDGSHYACKCLNIRIRRMVARSVATDLTEDPDFIQVFVGEEGISVAHTQVTVRTRTRGIPIPGTSRYSRYMTITCLLCNLLVYRVHQTYPADVEGRDGPLLPTEDWVERDIMKSLSGWIEVHKQCLTGGAIEEAIASPNYSTIFTLLLPSTLPPLPSPEPIFERPPSRSSASPLSPPAKYFSNLRPVFFPPPFTPSHPVFTHLASIASKESEAIREAAEEYMTEKLKAKTSEIEMADAKLRREVDTLWRKFREALGEIQQQYQTHRTRPSSLSRERSVTNDLESSAYGNRIHVRNFTPAVISPARSSPPHVTRVSALSASLATSPFPQSPPSSRRSSSTVSNGSNESSHSNSSTLIAPHITESSNVLKFPRNLHEEVDTNASYRFFINLEEDMARHRRARQLETDRQSQKESDQTQPSGPSRANTSNNNDKTHKKQGSESQSDGEKSIQHVEDGEDEVSPARGREKSKGKRKVTFDVQPAVVTIKREVNTDLEEDDDPDTNQDERAEMIFEFEDIDDQGPQQTLNFSRPTLQLVDQPVTPVRTRRSRPINSTGLSSSFSGLRPTSLPAPSHIRPPRSQHGADLSSSSMVLSLSKPPPIRKEKQSSNSEIDPSRDGDETNFQDSEILKLVAANTPSHRGAWKPDTKAWQTFVRRQPESGKVNGDIPEEDELDSDGDSNFSITETSKRIGKEDRQSRDQAPVIGSLPIPIRLARPPPALSLASYQPKTFAAQAEVPTIPLGQRLSSSNAIRRAVYAERDRSRSMDPGPLDFTAEEDGGADSDEDKIGGESEVTEAGGRGRKRALKILQVRSEIPEAGMWRSLAS